MNLSVGAYAPAPVGNNGMHVFTGSRASYNFFHQVTGNGVHGLTPSLFSINLEDETGTAFSSVTLPGVPAPNLNSFNVKRWALTFLNGDVVADSLDSLKAVPLPSTIVLFGVALIALAGLMRSNTFLIRP